MKLLIIAPQHVIPPTDGGKAGIFFPLRAFARRHEVHFAFPLPVECTDMATLLDQYRAIGVNPLPLPPAGRDTPLRIAASLVQPLPFKIAKYNTKESLCLIQQRVRDAGIQLIWVNHLHMMPSAMALQEEFGCPLILREHNFEADLIAQYAKLHSNPFHRWVASWQYAKTLAFERTAWKAAKQVLFISDSDLARALAMGAPDQSEGPLYDIIPIADVPSMQEDEPSISFLYPLRFSSVQNVYSARRFFTEVWAPFVQRHPRFELHITGCTKHDLARKLGLDATERARLNLRPLGMVDDYMAVLRTSRYFLSPTYFGSGLRVKLIEAMGQGCLCLCSALDLESLEVLKHGDNLISFDDAATFEREVLRLEAAPEERQRIRKAAWATARTHFSESAYLDRSEAVISKWLR